MRLAKDDPGSLLSPSDFLPTNRSIWSRRYDRVFRDRRALLAGEVNARLLAISSMTARSFGSGPAWAISIAARSEGGRLVSADGLDVAIGNRFQTRRSSFRGTGISALALPAISFMARSLVSVQMFGDGVPRRMATDRRPVGIGSWLSDQLFERQPAIRNIT